MTDPAEKVKILICEDDDAFRGMVRGLFESRGYSVCGEARSGVETISIADREKPDIIFLNLGMPKGSGLNVLPVLRDIDPNTCVIVVTSDASGQSVRAAISLGAKGYVLKNVDDPDRFLTALEKAVQCYFSPREETPPPPLVPSLVERDSRVHILTHDLEALGRVYISGLLHQGEMGSVYLYHPVTASGDNGELASTVRDVLRFPDFFLSILMRMNEFIEIPSILYEQEWDGWIEEIRLKPVSVKGRVAAIRFAPRYHDAAAAENLPLGLNPDGSPNLLNEAYLPDGERHQIDDKNSKRNVESVDLPQILRSFNGLSLELCLFLSAFNIAEILNATENSQSDSAAILAHLNSVIDFARWQSVPKAVLLGRLGLMTMPNSPSRKLLVTTSLEKIESTHAEYEQLFRWADIGRYSARLQHYWNLWRCETLPLVALKGIGTISILLRSGQWPSYGFKKSIAPSEVFDETGYTATSLERLVQQFPSLQLVDVMRPFIVNSLLVRDPSVRLEKTLESPLDVHEMHRHTERLLAGNGLESLRISKPHFYSDVKQALEGAGVDCTNPLYTQKLVHEITNRQRMIRNLPRLPKKPDTVNADQQYQRKRTREIEVLAERFKKKYG